MEVIAQGFTLNMEDLPVIERCVSIYTKWLLGGPEDKPPGLLAEETFFRGVRLIFHLFSHFPFIGHQFLLFCVSISLFLDLYRFNPFCTLVLHHVRITDLLCSV